MRLRNQLSLLATALALVSTSAHALTVEESDVTNKTRIVALREISFEGQPKVILTDIAGMSVYTFDQDEEGKSNCRGGCLTVWPPLHVTSDEQPLPPFGTITGNDGELQLTLHGHPLYYFKRDKKPGDIFGHYPDWQLVFVNR